MTKTTAVISVFNPSVNSGENISFEFCKGGYFSKKKEYGLKLVGKTMQNGVPTPENPIPIQCVKAGTKIICGESEIVTPCDLYEDDIWYPADGSVERHRAFCIFKGTEAWYTYGNNYMALAYWVNNDYISPDGDRYTASRYNYKSEMYVANYKDDIYNHSAHFATCSRSWIIFQNHFKHTLREWKAWIKDLYDSGKPLKVLYLLNTPIIEQYEPQLLEAPRGTANVKQEPTDIAGEIIAAMQVITKKQY